MKQMNIQLRASFYLNEGNYELLIFFQLMDLDHLKNQTKSKEKAKAKAKDLNIEQEQIKKLKDQIENIQKKHQEELEEKVLKIRKMESDHILKIKNLEESYNDKSTIRKQQDPIYYSIVFQAQRKLRDQVRQSKLNAQTLTSIYREQINQKDAKIAEKDSNLNKIKQDFNRLYKKYQEQSVSSILMKTKISLYQTKEQKGSNNKLLWAGLILFFLIGGILLYYSYILHQSMMGVKSELKRRDLAFADQQRNQQVQVALIKQTYEKKLQQLSLSNKKRQQRQQIQQKQIYEEALAQNEKDCKYYAGYARGEMILLYQKKISFLQANYTKIISRLEKKYAVDKNQLQKKCKGCFLI